ncbi:hypothetical protein B0H13DRAFT_165384 [Mycena leptocephala]|nr:hypothetical protein B0H13DRAFT_165384 [Mycena leptocephala]
MEPMPIDLQVVFYIKAGFLALLVYDSLLQINEEYLHVWKSRWTLIKSLYLWTRYIATFTTAFSGFIIGVTELILMVRTYTLYERSKKLLVFFFVLWFSVGGVAAWAMVKWTSSPSFKSSDSGVLSCWFSDASRIGIGLVCYLSLLVGETGLVLLTLGKVFREFYHHKSGLLKSLYCDGVWFYLAIWPSSIVTVLVLYFAPPGLNNLPDIPVLVMHSVLSCRLITHAREIAAEEDRRAYAVNKIFKERYLISDAVVDISPIDRVSCGLGSTIPYHRIPTDIS